MRRGNEGAAALAQALGRLGGAGALRRLTLVLVNNGIGAGAQGIEPRRKTSQHFFADAVRELFEGAAVS